MKIVVREFGCNKLADLSRPSAHQRTHSATPTLALDTLICLPTRLQGGAVFCLTAGLIECQWI